MSRRRILPNKIDQHKVELVNFEGEKKEITGLVEKMEIFENVFNYFCTCTLAISDAIGLLERQPIVGDETIIITYKTPGEKYKLIERTFKLYKTGERVESAQKQFNYLVHGIDEFGLFNEMQSIDKSFVGKNTLEAIQDVYSSVIRTGTVGGIAGSTAAGTTGGLGDLGGGGVPDFMKSTYTDKEDVIRAESGQGVTGTFIQNPKKLYGKHKNVFERRKCRSFTTYVAPGVSPMEAITQLMDEALHADTNNNSDYVFFQTYEGFHCTTLAELKEFDTAAGDGEDKLQFLLGDQSQAESFEDTKFTAQDIIMRIKTKKFVDIIQNLGTGLYRNRVAVVDPLTKRYDTSNFVYMKGFDKLAKLNPAGARVHSVNSQYRFPNSSTHTRYLVGELTTNSLNKKDPSYFSKDVRDAFSFGDYKDSPYINTRLEIDRDPKIKYPNERHKKLNGKIAERASLDTIVMEIVIPGNSKIKAGDVIYIYVPQPNPNETSRFTFNLFFGNDKSRFLVVGVRHIYLRSTQNFVTHLDIMKDSLEKKIETIRRNVKAELTS